MFSGWREFANDGVKDRGEEEPEKRDPEHAGKHGDAEGTADLESRSGGDGQGDNAENKGQGGYEAGTEAAGFNSGVSLEGGGAAVWP